MRKFSTVLKFELKEYFGSKGFVAFTLVLAFLGPEGPRRELRVATTQMGKNYTFLFVNL